MRCTTLLLGLVVLSLVASGSASARSATKTYDGPMMFVCCPSVAVPRSVDSDGSLELGGATFESLAGETVASVTVRDASGMSVDVLVCQDANADSQCGDAGDPTIEFCSDGAAHVLPIVGGKVLFVYVQAVNPILAGCDFAVAMSGTVAVTFA